VVAAIPADELVDNGLERRLGIDVEQRDAFAVRPSTGREGRRLPPNVESV
jgi:hypothetical protein